MTDEERCDVCGHLDSEHLPAERQIEGMWPCDVPGCSCIDIIIRPKAEAPVMGLDVIKK